MNLLIQKDDFSCGPIACINSLIALGYKLNSNDLKKRSRDLKCSIEYGTEESEIIKNLRKYTKVNRIYRPTKIKLDEALKNNILLCLYYCKDEDIWHYCVITKTLSEYIILNYYKNDKYSHLFTKSLNFLLTNHGKFWKIQKRT